MDFRPCGRGGDPAALCGAAEQYDQLHQFVFKYRVWNSSPPSAGFTDSTPISVRSCSKDGAMASYSPSSQWDHRGWPSSLDQAHRLAVRAVHGLDDGVDVVAVVGQEVVLERRVHLDHVGDLPGQDGHDGAGAELVLPVLEL